MPTPFGWKRQANAAAGVEAFALETGMGAGLVPYVFGSGVTDSGRIAARTRAGAAIAVPDAYSFGEMWELRFTFAETGNSQRQGIFMDVRTSAANSATVRGMEVSAQSEGNINVGTLSGGTFKGIPRGTSGTITNLFGVEAEITFNDAAWAGTVTLGAAIRGKVSLDDGGTNTEIYGVYIDGEPISGAVVGTALFGSNTHANLSWNYAIDVSQSVLVETDTATDVTLIRFTGADGSVYRVVHDTDAATVLAVVTD